MSEPYAGSDTAYDWNAYEADVEKVVELMNKMEECYTGYPRMVIVLALTRTIAAMFGPAKVASREDYLRRFPNYMRSMWKVMDEVVQ